MAEFPPEYVFDPADAPAGKGWTARGLIESLERRIFPDGFREFFDRDPERTPPAGDGLIVAPADGILELPSGEPGKLIVHLRLTDVHVQRVPLSGVVRSIERHGAEFRNPDHPEYLLAVRTVTTIESAAGPYEVSQITSMLTTRIENYLRVGQKATTGERLGRIRLGSTVVLRLPEGASVAAKSGDKVRGGETLVASLAPSG